MKQLSLLYILFFCGILTAQVPDFDIYVAPLIKGDALGYQSGPIYNITKRRGYDNQPSFTPDGKWIYFSSQRDSVQTDIYAADVNNWTVHQITRTPESEYSPVFFQDGSAFTTVRVELDSTQRMWQFNADGSREHVLMPNLDSMGYYCRIDQNNYVFFMVTEPSTMILADANTGKTMLIDTNIGRCIKMIPGENAFSYIVKESESTYVLKKYDLTTKTISVITSLPPVSEDYVWTQDAKLLMPRFNQLWWLDYHGTNGWGMLHEYEELKGKKIFRLALSPDGKMMAFVAEE